MATTPSPEHLADWTPRTDDPVFGGHFPGNPLLPGALLIDWAVTTLNQHTGRPADRGSVRQAKFPSPARPGVPLSLTYMRAPRGRERLTVTATGSNGEKEIVLELLLDTGSTCAGGKP